MSNSNLNQFVDNWLSSWTGNKPDKLIQFYSEDAVYIDPSNVNGLKGHQSLLKYFRKLLATNPNWLWTREKIYPVSEDEFLLKWKATIPNINNNNKPIII